jgi:hypothetical protein
MEEIDVVRSTMSESKVNFILNTTLWDSFDDKLKQIIHSFGTWTEIKFLDNNGNNNPSLDTIPNDKGGVYIFITKPDILPADIHLYLMYVGRALCTGKQNLRKRCKEYSTKQKRPKISRMIQQWGKYLYIRYLPLDDNSLISNMEAEIINKILPPFNDRIPDQEIQEAVEAFKI